MDNIITWLFVAFGVVVAVLIVAFMWEAARSAYFAVAAKWFGWSEDEKHERLTARERRIWEKEERQGKRDEIASGDVGRKRYGVNIAMVAIATLAFQVNLPWWEAGLIMAAVYVGFTMAVGLSFKW